MFAHPGRKWNTKPNKCKKCGKKSESVLAGLVHLDLDHGIKTSYKHKRYLDHLEMLEV